MGCGFPSIRPVTSSAQAKFVSNTRARGGSFPAITKRNPIPPARFLDQTLHLYPDRALYWEQTRTLVVTDVHFGKATTFRAHGIALPTGTTQSNLARLTTLLDRTKAEPLLILGDLLQAQAGRTASVLDQVTAWRQQFEALSIELVLGNHDHQAGRPPAVWRMRCEMELVEHPFVWRHKPGDSEAGYVLAGHVHPAVSLRGPGEQLILPCF